MGSAPPIYNLDPVQRLSAIKYLVLQICVVTGWAPPQAELKNILVQEFEKLLLENYPILNVNEIGLAFRRYGTKVKDWGKEMNLSLITDVLDSYWGERSESKKSANHEALIASGERILTEEDMDNEIRGQIQAFLTYKWQGKKNPLWMPQWGEILVKDGFIRDVSQTDQFIDFLIKNEVKEIYAKD